MPDKTTDHCLARLGIKTLNPMQEASLKTARLNQEIILTSPTGSGKTVAFLLPMLLRLSPEATGIQALVIVPSRELALQVESVFRKMSTGFKVNCCYGGHSMKTETNNLASPPAVLIGTPGRLADHLRRQNFDPTTIKALILDEFDKSLELGFQTDMEEIVSQLPSLKYKTLTSATTLGQIPSFVGLESPSKLDFLTEAKTNEGLRQLFVRSEGHDKLEALRLLMGTLDSGLTIVFCNHREAVNRISSLLRQDNFLHGIFHGGLDQEERERELLKFRNGSVNTLIATDLAARGLDIPEIKHVIHYQLPTDEKSFTHRNGRTSRMSAKGNSYLVLSSEETVPEYIQESEQLELPLEIRPLTPPEWTTLYISAGKKDKIRKMDLVGWILQKGGIEKGELGIIEVQDKASYVAVKRDVAQSVISKLEKERLKKRKVRIALAK
ncbi:helicase [Fulvitalea axinellae]|uniref:Helicase n=1 Tax=Fulvitalea axinellae TaxID=1182444 RepID=A0AAU9D7M7_9BACT|nr:helicase [Fulvitalea axinellae]